MYEFVLFTVLLFRLFKILADCRRFNSHRPVMESRDTCVSRSWLCLDTCMSRLGSCLEFPCLVMSHVS